MGWVVVEGKPGQKSKLQGNLRRVSKVFETESEAATALYSLVAEMKRAGEAYPPLWLEVVNSHSGPGVRSDARLDACEAALDDIGRRLDAVGRKDGQFAAGNKIESGRTPERMSRAPIGEIKGELYTPSEKASIALAERRRREKKG